MLAEAAPAVVPGGLHPCALREQVLVHADAVTVERLHATEVEAARTALIHPHDCTILHGIAWTCIRLRPTSLGIMSINQEGETRARAKVLRHRWHVPQGGSTQGRPPLVHRLRGVRRPGQHLACSPGSVRRATHWFGQRVVATTRTEQRGNFTNLYADAMDPPVLNRLGCLRPSQQSPIAQAQYQQTQSPSVTTSPLPSTGPSSRSGSDRSNARSTGRPQPRSRPRCPRPRRSSGRTSA